ncbi:MAG: shikimate dehydrogenase [Clostridia bacterium]|nr:shikimate dehydrogenase [Clostridia bacterium]
MKYGLIAEKVGHSFSAEIHDKLFGYPYELKAIANDELEAFMLARDFCAVNVTIPYKQAVIPYLDYVDQTALEIGAVNTIVNRENKLFGYNTDILGLTAMIQREGIEIKNKKVLVLGSGGTSKTAFHTCKKLGCLAVYRVSRNGNDGCITYEEAINNHSDADVIINTTPVGMFPNIAKSAIDINSFPNLSGVVDAVYNPLRSKLVCDALKRGIKAVGGLYMLVAQAAFAAEKFVGKSVQSSRIDEIYREMLLKKQNIVLVGMPASGKTSTGKLIAQSMNFEFVDTDNEIYKATGKYPHEIIVTDGEGRFRDIESAVIKEISKRQGCVISTGGGAILRKENTEYLRENGRIYFLDRALKDIGTTVNRPLSSNRADLEKRYNERYPLYLECADCRIVAVDGKQLNADAILKEVKNENSRA